MIADVNFRQLFSSRDSAVSWILAHVPLQSAPGDISNFSEFDYFVLGRVIEKLSGRKLCKRKYPAAGRNNRYGVRLG